MGQVLSPIEIDIIMEMAGKITRLILKTQRLMPQRR
jgi:hypothetical protein